MTRLARPSHGPSVFQAQPSRIPGLAEPPSERSRPDVYTCRDGHHVLPCGQILATVVAMQAPCPIPASRPPPSSEDSCHRRQAPGSSPETNTWPLTLILLRSDDTATVRQLAPITHTPGGGERTPHLLCALHYTRACAAGTIPVLLRFRAAAKGFPQHTWEIFFSVFVLRGFVLLGEIIYRDDGPGPGVEGD